MNRNHICAFLAIALLCGSFSSSEGKQVIFYNDDEIIKTSNLFITVPRTKPCENGMKRDHNNRCRRTVTFSRKRRS